MTLKSKSCKKMTLLKIILVNCFKSDSKNFEKLVTEHKCIKYTQYLAIINIKYLVVSKIISNKFLNILFSDIFISCYFSVLKTFWHPDLYHIVVYCSGAQLFKLLLFLTEETLLSKIKTKVL